MKYTKAIAACAAALVTLLVTFNVLAEDVGAAIMANLPLFIGSITSVTGAVWLLPNTN